MTLYDLTETLHYKVNSSKSIINVKVISAVDTAELRTLPRVTGTLTAEIKV